MLKVKDRLNLEEIVLKLTLVSTVSLLYVVSFIKAQPSLSFPRILSK